MAAVCGIFLVGAGVAFNAGAGLGNDPVGMFYDGIRVFLNLSTAQLGLASNVVNVAVVIFLLFAGRRYVNIGTLIYIVPYGFCVDLGTKIYDWLLGGGGVIKQSVGVITGSIFICLGVAIFIIADIGVDPLTGFALYMGEKLKWNYRKTKVLFDICITALGFCLGGKLGIATLLMMLLYGPTIQFFADGIREIISENRRKEITSKVKA